jgi:hypothetical protein
VQVTEAPCRPKSAKRPIREQFSTLRVSPGEQYFGQEGHSKRRNVCGPSYKQYTVYFLLCIIDDNTVVSGASKEAVKLFEINF